MRRWRQKRNSLLIAVYSYFSPTKNYTRRPYIFINAAAKNKLRDDVVLSHFDRIHVLLKLFLKMTRDKRARACLSFRQNERCRRLFVYRYSLDFRTMLMPAFRPWS